MSTGYAALFSLAVCILAAALEGLCAGRNVKPFFTTLRFPPYSAPLWKQRRPFAAYRQKIRNGLMLNDEAMIADVQDDKAGDGGMGGGMGGMGMGM